MIAPPRPLTVRPYRLMDIIAKIGGDAANLHDARLTEILRRVRENPRIAITLRCNVEGNYAWQNPGHSEDTPEGALFNAKRDLDILQRLGLVPGSTRPADELFLRLLASIPTAEGICTYDDVTSETWKGLPREYAASYAAGHALGIDAIIPGRSSHEKADSKAASAADMAEAKELRIRPHHLLCMACFHAGRENLTSIAEDNVFEAIDIIHKNPGIPILLVPGCCMICPPCSHYDPKTNWCVLKIGAGLRDEKKDLDVLQLLGLDYGDRRPARDLFILLFHRIPSTRMICAFGDGVARAPEWSICGDVEGNPQYAKAREAKLGIPGL